VISHTHLQCISERRLHNRSGQIFNGGRDIFTAGRFLNSMINPPEADLSRGEFVLCYQYKEFNGVDRPP